MARCRKSTPGSDSGGTTWNKAATPNAVVGEDRDGKSSTLLIQMRRYLKRRWNHPPFCCGVASSARVRAMSTFR